MAFIRLQLRRDTAANWTSANPTLAEGELGIETDTEQFKIGNGADAWDDLIYAGIQGDTGPAGADGRTILSGAVDPTTEGVDSDFYINTATSTLFGPKASGTWPSGVLLIGADGVGVPVGGTTGQALVKNSNTNYDTEWASVSGAPGGSDTFVQFNDGGVLGGDAGLVFNKTTNALTIDAGTLNMTGSSSGTITIQPAAAAGTYTLTLPTSDGDNGQTLFTDGLGVLSWGSLGALATITPGTGVATAAEITVNGSGGFVTSATYEAASGKKLTASNTLTLAGTDSTTMTFPSTSATLAGLAIAQTFTAKQTFDLSGEQLALGGTNTGVFSLAGSTSGKVTIQAANAAGTYTLTLPTSDGDAGQFLKTDGSGVLSWDAAGGGGGTKSLGRFTPLDNQPPATNFATLDTRNSVAVLDFDDGATNEESVFVGVIPEAATLTSGIKVRIFWAATSATSGAVEWGAQFEKYGTDIDSDSFDTATFAITTTSGTSGIVNLTEITCTTIDSLAAGDQFRIKIVRNSSDTTDDTMTGDAELVAVELQQVA